MRWSLLGLKCFAVLHGIAHANETEKTPGKEAFVAAVLSGNWDVAEEIATSGSIEDRDILIARIDDLIARSKTGSKAVEVAIKGKNTAERRVVSPAFQWAQNVSFVFIEAKYAHKMSAPARTSHVIQQVSIEPTSLYLSALPPPEKAGGEPRFELTIAFASRVLTNVSTWAAASAGRITFTLKKETDGHWAELIAPGTNRPNNMRFWWDMQESLGDTGWMKSDDSSAGRTGVKGPTTAKVTEPSGEGGIADDAADGGEGAQEQVKTDDGKEAKGSGNDGEAAAGASGAAADASKDYEKRKRTYVKKSNKVTKEYKAKIKEVKSKALKEKKTITAQADSDKKQADAEMFKATRGYREEADHMRFFADSPPDYIANIVPAWATYLLLKDPVWTIVLEIAQVQQLRNGRLGNAKSQEVKKASQKRSSLLHSGFCALAGGGFLLLIGAAGLIWGGREVLPLAQRGLLNLFCCVFLVSGSALVAATGLVFKGMGEW